MIKYMEAGKETERGREEGERIGREIEKVISWYCHEMHMPQ